jgi:hypothetical protein
VPKSTRNGGASNAAAEVVETEVVMPEAPQESEPVVAPEASQATGETEQASTEGEGEPPAGEDGSDAEEKTEAKAPVRGRARRAGA